MRGRDTPLALRCLQIGPRGLDLAAAWKQPNGRDRPHVYVTCSCIRAGDRISLDLPCAAVRVRGSVRDCLATCKQFAR